MGNIWYDVPLIEEFKLYFGGGAGLAIVNADGIGVAGEGVHYDSSEAAIAVQVGAGIRWRLAEWIVLDVGYRLRGIDRPTFDVNENYRPDASDFNAEGMWSHNVIGGVSFGL